MKVEHIGIAVKQLQQAEQLYAKLFQVTPYKRETVESESVTTSFLQFGETKIELLEATNSSSAIAKYIEKKGEGIHHIAFEVDNILEEMTRLRDQGIRILNPEPKRGADNKLICFLHPKDCGGILVELCQEIPEKNEILS